MDILRGKLKQLMMAITENYDEQEWDEYQNAEHSLRTAELGEAHYLRRVTRINWLGQGEEPSWFYFATLRGKRKEKGNATPSPVQHFRDH